MRYFILSISFCLILTLAGLSQDVAASPHSRSLSQLHPACVVDAGSGLWQSRGSGRVAKGRVMQRARWRERRRKRVGRRETGRARKGRVWAINRPNVSYKLPMA